jgi:hypothetical protein
MTVFKAKFEDASKLYDVSIREDRYFVSELLALDSLIAHLDDIPLFSNQLIMINLATLDVLPPFVGSDIRESITNMVLDQLNTTLPSNYSLH